MNDKNKTKDQLIRELVEFRQRLSELESVAAKQKVEAEFLAESGEIDLEKLRNQAQSTLEERYRTLFENNPIETIIVDHEAKITGFNSAVRRTGSEMPNIGDVMFKDYASSYEVDMHGALINCMKFGMSREFPKQKYDGRCLQVRISPFSRGAIITSMDITNQVLVEGAMRKRQKQIRVLAHALESCPQPLAVAYPDGRIMTYNAAFCKLTGYKKDELHTVRYFSDLAPKAWRSIIKEAEDKIRRTKKPQQFENEFVRKDGSRVFVETSAHPIYDSDGNLQHFYYFFSDVDERKHLEEALVASEARSRAIVENNPTQTTIVDHEGRVIYSNLSKIRPGESVQNIGDVVFKDNAGGVKIEVYRELMRCMKSGIPKEFPEQKYDDRFLHIKISPFSGGAIITSVDVTKLRSMASALKENEERLRVIADFANYWEFWVGRDGKHVYVSPSCERITGYRPEEFQRDPELLKQIIHPDDRALMGVHLGDEFEAPEPKNLEFRILKRGGDERWIIHLCQPVYGPNGRFLGRRASNRDCTDSKKIQSLLQSRTAELGQIRNELSQYRNVFSSELRAPLRAIHNYIDFLREELGEGVGDAKKAYLDGLAHATIEAGALLEDLSEFSQIEGRGEPLEKVQVGSFLRELIASLHVPPEVKLVIVDDWPTLEVQPNLLRQIFQNLIDNALKFNNSSQKLVEIGWRSTEDESYEFHVRDNGIGIQPRHADQVFGMFERLHTLKEYEGNGMGLAIVKKATIKLGGSVRLISKPGEGSTFFVTLPRTQKETCEQ